MSNHDKELVQIALSAGVLAFIFGLLVGSFLGLYKGSVELRKCEEHYIQNCK